MCARLLAKDPADRYPSAEALIEDLDAIGRGEVLASVLHNEPTQPIPPPFWTRRHLGLIAAARRLENVRFKLIEFFEETAR